MEQEAQRAEHTQNEHEGDAEGKRKTMDLLEAVFTRRSVRKFNDRDVEWDKVSTIIMAGQHAPSSGNLQNWMFCVVQDEDKRRKIAEACMQQYWMQDAKVHIVVAGDPKQTKRYYADKGDVYTIQNCAAAIQNMLLTAHALGLGACWVGAFDEDEIWRILGLPEEISVQGVLTIGYADENPESPPKHRIEHIMFFEKWWGRLEAPKTYLGWWSAYNKRIVDESKKLAKKVHKKVKEKVKGKLKK